MEQKTNNKRKPEDTFQDFLYDNKDAKKQATEEELTLRHMELIEQLTINSPTKGK